jgi:hypothetical protein
LRRIERIEAAAIAAEAAEEGCRVFLLDTGANANREAFFDAVRATLPLDPPLMSARSWDALEDSLWEGLSTVEESHIVIVWLDSAPLMESDLSAFDLAIDVLGAIADSLADSGPTDGNPKDVRVFVA